MSASTGAVAPWRRGLRRRVGVGVLAATGWTAVVATVSVVAWAAIDSAGRQVGGQAPPPMAAPVAHLHTALAWTSPPGSGAASPAAVTRTTDGGRVAVACTADGARLRWASPAQGWRVERREMRADGPVRVDFIGGGREIVVRVTCAGGSPEFDVVEEIPPQYVEGDDD